MSTKKADAFLLEAKPVLESLRQILVKHEISFVFAAALDDKIDPEFLGAKQLAVASALEEGYMAVQLLFMLKVAMHTLEPVDLEMYQVWRSMVAQNHRTDFEDVPTPKKGSNHARYRRRK